jgi:hypothetical protein
LQEQACWVIIYVAATSVVTSESLVQRGAVEHVVASMRATNSDTNSRIIFESKGIDVIISAMRLFPANLSVQAKGCRGLGRIARHYEMSCGHIREHGGVEAVMQCMNLHKNSATVQQEGTIVLKTMAGEFLRGMGMNETDAMMPGLQPSWSPDQAGSSSTGARGLYGDRGEPLSTFSKA